MTTPEFERYSFLARAGVLGVGVIWVAVETAQGISGQPLLTRLEKDVGITLGDSSLLQRFFLKAQQGARKLKQFG